MKKIMRKVLSLTLTAFMALNILAIPGWSAVTVANYSTYEYAANGVIQKQQSFSAACDGTGLTNSLQSTTFYNANGQPSYTTDTNGAVIRQNTYNTLTGALETASVTFTGADDAQHVMTYYYLPGGVSVGVDRGAGATLTKDGVTGGTNAYSFAQVASAYNDIINNGGTWSGNGINIANFSAPGAVIAGLSDSTIARLFGYSGVGTTTGTIGQADVSTIRAQAAANPTQSFSLSFNANGQVENYSYYDKASAQMRNCKIAPQVTQTDSGDPLVTGAIQSVTYDETTGQYYVAVEAKTVNMFDGVDAEADGETIIVTIDAATYASLQGKEGLEISISGDHVSTDSNGYKTMTMNEGGFVVGATGSTNAEWKGKNQDFYTKMVTKMTAWYSDHGVMNANWKEKWAALNNF